MATHDYIISNASGAAVRADLNNALAAIATNNSSATEPTTTYAYQWWADTGSSPTVMKLRNAANSAWITLFQLDGEWSLIPFENGTAAAPSIYFKDSGTDTGIYSPGTDQVGISAGGTSRFEVSTTATTSTLPVVHPLGAVGTPSITFTGDLNTGIYSPTADTIAFVEGGVEAARIDSSGRLLVGATTARSNFFNTTFATSIQLEGTTSVSSSLSLISNRSTAEQFDQPILILGRSGGTSIGSNTAVANTNAVGSISFQGNDGTEFVQLAEITAFVDDAPGANDMPGRLVFSTTSNGASSPTERMRIQADGEINFFDNGATGQNAFRWIRNVGTGTANSGALNLAFNSVNRAPGVTPSALYWDSSTGNITIQTSSAQFKRNILDVTDEQLDKALNLRPCYFQRKEYDYWEYGFIAEEVEDAGLEELVAKVDDKVVSLDYSKISVFCIGLIKKHEEKIESLIAENVALMTRLETLEAKVAALEGA
jgi:hypothetical protein